MHTVKLFIHGQSVDASSGLYFERISPIDATVASRSAAATTDDVDAAITSAHQAFPAWAKLTPSERQARLLKAADLMLERTQQFIDIGMQETGSTAAWYGFNVQLSAQILREAAALCTHIQGNIIPSNQSDNLAMAIRQPCGVIVSMAPWNAPVILAMRAIAMPLACGNTVVFKASESCPAIHRLIIDVLNDAGFSQGVLNFISHSADDAAPIVERLISHPLSKRINFTGSTRVGKIIASTAAQYLKPVLLELGGKAPVVVLAKADLNEAVNAVAFGAFFNQGQICMSTERVLVDQRIADEFIEKLIEKTRSLSAGNPVESKCELGLLESVAAGERLHALLQDCVDHGATLPLGIDIQGATMQPTVVLDLTADMRLYREESFGPVCTVQRFENVEQAIQLANDSEFGLAAAVFSQDLAEAMHVAKQIESGICHINAATVHDEAQMPFGGMKNSGYGRFGGQACIDEFTELRWISIQAGQRHYPI